MLFALLKRILRLDRLRLRGPCSACDEFLLAASVQNLRRLAKLIPKRHPQWRAENPQPPHHATRRSSRLRKCPTAPTREFFNRICHSMAVVDGGTMPG
jgi:hypothetical protein